MNSLHVNQQLKATSVDFDPFAEGELLLTAPATESQKEIWASVQMGSEANCAYNESQTLQLKGDLDVESFQSALQQLILHHEALRTTFSPDGTTLCISSSFDYKIPVIDLTELELYEQKVEVATLRRQVVEQPFDLEHGSLFRVQLLKLHSQEHLVMITVHHIICDGWSWAVLMPDLGNLYSALKQGQTPELEEAECFSQYAISQAAAVESEEAIATENYWLQQYAQSVPVLDFPTDHPRPPFRTFESAREDWDLSPALVPSLKQLGTKLGCSFMSTLLAGFEVWLHRLTGQSDIVVGVLAAGQAATEMYNTVGHCVNLLPMRSLVMGEQSFKDYLQSRRAKVLDDYDHQQFTFGTLIQKLSIPRDPSRIPLVPILLNIDQGLDSAKLPFHDLEVELFSNPRSFENFELFVNATEMAGKLTLECQYNTNLFDAETIRRRLAEFETLLTGLVADPDQAIAALPFLPSAEQQLLSQWNQTQSIYPDHLCLHQLIEEQVKRTPEAIAVILEDQQLTYEELDRQANQLAHYLQSLGAQAETLVGISMERTSEMLVAMLGVLKVGAAYIPLDPTYPSDRLAFMMADSQIELLLTHSSIVTEIPASQAKVVCLDQDGDAMQKHSVEPLSYQVSPDSLAYVIYTSGSTGTPKGVQITHQGVVNFLHAMQKEPGMVQEDVLLSVTTLSFDIAVLELLLPLTVGATTVLVSRQVAMDGEALLNALERFKVTVMQATPATWRLLLAANWQGSPNLKILSGGEALPSDLARELVQRAQVVWNLYGPTETTIWSTAYKLETDDVKPLIGKPIVNTRIHLLDANLQPVPIGVSGELHIGGDGLARGYLNRPELTAEKFIPDPLSAEPGNRLYKTGDLARFLSDGQIEYIGRIDHQVKVRGFRIELGEIEATLLQHPTVKEAIAIVREDTPGEKLLVGYFVPQTGTDGAGIISELRRSLKTQLPDYMVPTILMALDALPLTPNGKANRKALPQPDAYRPELAANYVAPKTTLETQIAELWAQVLKLERVGIEDNFFDLGGYSLLAMQVITRLRQAIAIELSLRTFFEAPTVAELADRIETVRWATQGLKANEAISGAYEEGEL